MGPGNLDRIRLTAKPCFPPSFGSCGISAADHFLTQLFCVVFLDLASLGRFIKVMEKNFVWDLESEYASCDSAEFLADVELVQNGLARLEKWVAEVAPEFSDVELMQKILNEHHQTRIVANNVGTYLHCSLSVNTADAVAEAKLSEVEALISKLNQTMMPVNNYLRRCSDEALDQVLNHPELKPAKFLWADRRKMKDTLLSDSEETLLESMGQAGHRAWGELYNKLCGTIRCHLKYPDRTEVVGLAQASAMTRDQNAETRRVAWTSIQEAWQGHQDAAAAILNALAGWRHEEYKRRSYARKVHFLDIPAHGNRIERATLDAMLSACENNLPKSRRALFAMAKLMGKEKLDPWDLLAQSPVTASGVLKTPDQAMEIIRESFAGVDPQFAEFAMMMAKNRWLEGRVLPNKRNGGYCTRFPKRREPRVFMTYLGSNNDVSTLAHEIGHAFHSWVMRDMSEYQTQYTMSLAETASIFAETVLHDAMIEKGKTREEKLEFAWGEVEGAASFLINIPARFEFEKNFYELREKRSLNVNEFRKLTDDAWTKWYGPTLTKNDDMFWASKLHFHMAGRSFYNFPYTFGYLFSLSIYARRKELGANFFKKYIEILRDTGRMTAEDLVQKHLGEDIGRPEFWQKSIDVINGKVENFERIAFGG